MGVNSYFNVEIWKWQHESNNFLLMADNSFWERFFAYPEKCGFVTCHTCFVAYHIAAGGGETFLQLKQNFKKLHQVPPGAPWCITVMEQDQDANQKVLFSKTLRHQVLAWKEHCLAKEQWICWKAVNGAITTALEQFIRWSNFIVS